MSFTEKIFKQNKKWSKNITDSNPSFFKDGAEGQEPKILWIGCADSRVPPAQLMGLLPGDVFVHRNIANVVVHSDLNSMSVLEYAVANLRVEHVVVCGHYGCGGVQAAMANKRVGLIDNWLRHIKDVRAQHEQILDTCSDDGARFDTLCELNVRQQVLNVCHTTIVQNAWAKGQKLSVHGWIYQLKDGLLKNLDTTICKADDLSDVYRLTDCCGHHA